MLTFEGTKSVPLSDPSVSRSRPFVSLAIVIEYPPLDSSSASNTMVVNIIVTDASNKMQPAFILDSKQDMVPSRITVKSSNCKNVVVPASVK